MIRGIIISLLLLAVGFAAGAYLFSNTQPRALLAVPDCAENCFSPQEVLGLFVSAGIQQTPGAIPSVRKETERAVVVRHPIPQAQVHYVAFPKRDIQDIADLTEEDKEYLVETMAVLGEIVREEELSRYRILSNGQEFQTVRYLHFHLLADR